MNLSDFDYDLPPELIAQKPIEPRDHSRLLILDKKLGNIHHKKFYNIIEYLNKGDILVMNNSKVFPARLIGKKEKTGGKVEVFLHHKKNDFIWQCMIGGKNAKPELKIIFSNTLHCTLKKNNRDGTWDVKFNKEGDEMMDIVNKIGLTPLPPYIKREKQNKKDKNLYQTVYADKSKTGSVAAPTAGLHFTPELLKKIKEKGVKIEYITLHVGLGTFAPVKVDNIKKHKMHAEWVEANKKTIENISRAKKNKNKIITVGTTTTRSLEAIFNKFDIQDSTFENFHSWVDIFIYPGYKFKAIDAMITNFHLPKSTLLMLISAFAGKTNIDKSYKNAVIQHYRFFSYGDAMLIL